MFVAQAVHGGGAEVVVCRWSNRLVELGHQVDVVTTDPKLQDAQLDRRVTRFRLREASAFRKVIALRRLVSRRDPDVVMSHLTRQNVLLLASMATLSRARRPMVAIEEHSVLSLISGSSVAGIGGRFLARTLYPRADLVIAVSHATAADLLRYGVDADTVRVVANPLLEDGELASLPRVPDGAKAGTHPLRLIASMRLVPQKRPIRALEATRELRNRGYDARLVFFGAGPLLEEMRTASRAMDVPTEFRGWTESWTEACEREDIVLLPSRVEGFGNVLIEAAAAGLRVVAPSTALGVADAVVPGVTGELALTASASDLADAVERAMKLEPPSLPAWLDRFSTRESTDALLAVLASRPSARASSTPEGSTE
ncbi:glycosyltransferase [Humibacter sp. RRB41]|uniref:glycosyltransferase n=1 Tax=Humibacter sp. RRB41 TaxID=2919946 RepID=UPI001FAA1ABB|nr:glycosyltransferase [Humibacter sp. RRB41]